MANGPLVLLIPPIPHRGFSSLINTFHHLENVNISYIILAISAVFEANALRVVLELSKRSIEARDDKFSLSALLYEFQESLVFAQHDVQEEEVTITSDELVSTSQEVTRQIEKQKDVANITESLEPDKSKSTRGDEHKPMNSKAKSNQTHARTNDEEGKDSVSKTKSTGTGDTHTVVSCPSADGKITYYHR